MVSSVQVTINIKILKFNPKIHGCPLWTGFQNFLEDTCVYKIIMPKKGHFSPQMCIIDIHKSRFNWENMKFLGIHVVFMRLYKMKGYMHMSHILTNIQTWNDIKSVWSYIDQLITVLLIRAKCFCCLHCQFTMVELNRNCTVSCTTLMILVYD